MKSLLTMCTMCEPLSEKVQHNTKGSRNMLCNNSYFILVVLYSQFTMLTLSLRQMLGPGHCQSQNTYIIHNNIKQGADEMTYIQKEDQVVDVQDP